MLKRSVIVATLALCLVSQATAQTSGNRLTLAGYLDYETVDDPRLSPDGSRVVYTRQWFDKLADRQQSSVWIVNADGTRNRFLIDGSNARWSPSGDRLAFVAPGEPKGPQVFVRWMDAEGSVTQITRVDQSPSNVAWSPDGTKIAFTMLVEKKNEWPIDLPTPPQGAKWTESPKIIERLEYRRDGIGYIDTGYLHIFVVAAEGGTPRQITSGDYDHPGRDPTANNNLAWTPDSQQILFSGLRAQDADYQWRESEIYAVDVATSEVHRLTDRKGQDQTPRVSPDGTKVAYRGYDWHRYFYLNKIYVMDIDGRNPRLVSGDWDRRSKGLFWGSDSDRLYLTAENEGSRNLYALPLTGPEANKVVPVTEGNHWVTVSEVSPKGQAVAVRTDFHRPPDVVLFDVARASAMKQLTHVNDDILEGIDLGDVEEIWYEAPDGVRVQGWYMTPPNFDATKTYPMQLHIHGGPHSMYGAQFKYSWHEHAANDYVILFTNPRGSSGYGSKFGNLIADAYPGPDYQDLMAGVDTMLEKGFVDEQNLFVTGCSGGGTLTAWVVTQTDRFAAASSNCTSVDWISKLGNTDIVISFYRFPKLPWEDPTLWLKHSPINHVENVKTPTMLITGEEDLRTPITQAEQFYRALKFLKVPTALLRYKDQAHGTGSRPSNFMRTQLYLRYWFDKYKRPSGRATDHQE